MNKQVITKVNIRKNYYPIAGVYKYDAQVVRSIDGGKTYYHCGEGRYCKSYKEAKDYKSKIENRK